jgi:hypothetical protein
MIVTKERQTKFGTPLGGAVYQPFFGRRITPTPIVLRSRSGYFERAFSACSFVLKGFDKGVNSPAMYLKSSHCTIVPGISNV